jgi:hypothetical protein
VVTDLATTVLSLLSHAWVFKVTGFHYRAWSVVIGHRLVYVGLTPGDRGVCAKYIYPPPVGMICVRYYDDTVTQCSVQFVKNIATVQHCIWPEQNIYTSLANREASWIGLIRLNVGIRGALVNAAKSE